MSLAAGLRLGPYEIVAPLGAGGMGDVYRARDTRLDRVVAIKVLPSDIAEAPQLRQRFEREARAISSLNHPNICALYDVGEVAVPEPIPFLVMELVEGESLADRLTKGRLPLSEALRRGIEIADALSCAHRRGIVHRDIKPGNVMLTRSGAKLLDFGLAKAGPPASLLQRGIAATTITPRDLTAHGTIVGTFQYMAPEQLEGLDVDARTDIFAFGALLFEMVSGRKAFAAKTQASLIGAILRDQPPALSTVDAAIPMALDRVITKCLAKDPDHRWQDASDLREALQWIAESGSQVGAPVSPAARWRPRERLAWALFASALAGVVALSLLYLRTPPPASVIRFTIAPPAGVSFAPRGAPVAPFPAVSPDGTMLAFVAQRSGEAAPSVWVQTFDSLDARQLADTNVRTDTLSPALPFWSPDSRAIGFFADGKLKRVDVNGGAPQTICDAPQAGGASWSANGTIVFASTIDAGLHVVAATGGVPAPLTTPDDTRGEISHSNPAFLPDGRHFLFWVQAPKSSIRVGSIDSAESKPLFESDSRALYASGHVFFVRQNTLFAQPFDSGRLETTGEPIAISEDVRTFPLNGRSAFSASTNGVLVYRTGTVASGRPLAWYDRSGNQIAIVPDSTALYSGLSLAADDRHVMAQIEEGNSSDLWMIDLAQGTRLRITSDPKSEGSPVLSPDGRMVAFTSDRDGVDDLFRKRADGSGDEQVLLKSTVRKYPTHWSRGLISFTAFDAKGNLDLWILEPDREPRPYLQTAFSEHGGQLSPDERWMLYTSDEAGRNAIFLRPFPDANGGKWRVSGASVGVAPRWRADGREIFYADEAGRIVAVPVKLGGAFPELGLPQVLFRTGGLGRAQYEVSRDGTRFLAPLRDGSQPDAPLSVVLNWPTLLAGR
jgi:Tol biopolymer transport system component